ncbi:MAG TPA: PQQ-dependent sugar dehydrogenase [Steroidobacteraceae bacterium]|nr:PQQ-dependent sugar dehydrogenase [Steroidobacteraceae bacterium]
MPAATALVALGCAGHGAALAAGPPSDWHADAPGVRHHITVATLAPPYATPAAANPPEVIERPPQVRLRVPAGFTVERFGGTFEDPRALTVAPDGDLFIAESLVGRIRVLRVRSGGGAPLQDRVYASGLERPFGIAFYPLGPNPRWIYVAENDRVIRFAYQDGDLQARAPAQVIVGRLTQSTGGHWTRDLAFSRNGAHLYVSVGSASNDAQEMPKKSIADVRRWQAERALGAAWGDETDRADVLVFDPVGKARRRIFAAGIRNCVGLAVNPTTGDLWCSTNERDGLGDDLPPDYVTRVRDDAFYGWPWYYIGSHEDPRHRHERPDLEGKVTVPDVLVQAHSAPLEMLFYQATRGPAAFPSDYDGDVFVALHGSWNRSGRTGYKVVRLRLRNGVASGDYDDFLTGFIVSDTEVWGRPVGVAELRDGSLIVSEDGNGTLWRIAYAGERESSPASPEVR